MKFLHAFCTWLRLVQCCILTVTTICRVLRVLRPSDANCSRLFVLRGRRVSDNDISRIATVTLLLRGKLFVSRRWFLTRFPIVIISRTTVNCNVYSFMESLQLYAKMHGVRVMCQTLCGSFVVQLKLGKWSKIGEKAKNDNITSENAFAEILFKYRGTRKRYWIFPFGKIRILMAKPGKQKSGNIFLINTLLPTYYFLNRIFSSSEISLC